MPDETPATRDRDALRPPPGTPQDRPDAADLGTVEDRLRPLEGRDRGRRATPFTVVAVAGTLSLAVPPWPQPGPVLVAGIAALAALLVGGAWLPWRRWPAWPQAVPPLLYFVALALMRQAAEGATSGLAPLAALPVVWLALYGTWHEMMIAVAGCATLFLAPVILIGAPLYPLSDWRRAALWAGVGLVVGTSIQRLSRSRERHAASLDSLLSLTRRLEGVPPDVARMEACAAAAEIIGGFTVLMEPDRDANLRSSTISGVDLPPVVMPLSGLVTGSVIAYKTGERLYVADTSDSTLVSKPLIAATGAASMLYEPVRREGQVIGVLCVGFLTARPALDPAATAIMELITQQLASLITRVDLLTRLEALAADASDMVGRYEMTNDGFRFRYASPSAYALLGRRPETLIGTSPLDLVHPDDRVALAPIPAALLDGNPVTTAYRAAHADGHWVWLESTVRPIVDPATGRVTEVQATSRDIGDRKQMENELREAHNLFAGVLDAATEYSIIGTDPDGLITVFNGGAERILGYTAAEMVGRATPAIIHDPAEIAERAAELGLAPGMEALFAIARQGHADSREWTYLARDGRRLHVALTVTAMRDNPQGRLTGFIGIAHDLAERDATMQQVSDAYQRELAMVRQLKDLASARDDFVSAVTHDLRTPLTSIRGYAEILTHTADSLPAPQRKMLAVIDRNAERLLRLVDDLLTMARMEAGKLHLIMAPVSAVALIGEVCRDFEPEALRRHLIFKAAAHPDLGVILVDAHHIERVLSNLVSNAMKFTPDGGRVSLEAERHGDAITIRVTDTGVGIPEAEQQHLFARFNRASTAIDAQTPGTGLGLTIARRIVEQHGGTITLESVLGAGTTVTVCLPSTPPDPAAATAAPAGRPDRVAPPHEGRLTSRPTR